MTFLSIDLDKRIQCSEEEKQECLKLAEKLVRMAERARQKGILQLEEELDSDLPYLLRIGLRLVLDGTEPAIVDKTLTAYICSTPLEGKELLKYLVIRIGILGIQQGHNPRILRMQLLAYFGTEFASKVVDDTAAALEEFYEKIQKELPLSDDTLALEEELGILKDRGIQKTLRRVDQYILANALAGTSGAIRIRTMRNMSPRAALLLKEDLEDREARSIEEIMEAQHLVLQIIKQLKEEGEI